MNQYDFSNPSEGIFNYTTEGIFIVNPKGEIVRANPSGKRMFGYDQTFSMVGMRIEELIPDRFRNHHHNYQRGYFEHPKDRPMGLGLELYGKRKDSTEFPVEISLSPFKNGDENFVIAFIIDISVRKDAEDKLIAYKNQLEKEVEDRTLDLKNTIQRLEKIKDDLDEALKSEQELGLMKSRFLSMASHEFRTPLSTILSSIALVEKYGNARDMEKRDRHIVRIKTAVRNLTDILNDFLSLNRLEEGKIITTIEEFDLNEILHEIKNQMMAIAKEQQEIILETSGERIFKTDPRILTNILMNLLSNAIKFSDEDGKVWINCIADKEKLVIKVKDHGIGIPQSEQKYMFERFYRMSNAANIQGTGLGLSIVKHYVQLLNGEVSFTSTENVGTEFTVTIPWG